MATPVLLCTSSTAKRKPRASPASYFIHLLEPFASNDPPRRGAGPTALGGAPLLTKQRNHLPRVALTLVLVVVVEYHLRDFGLLRKLARQPGNIGELLGGVVVVESLGGRAQALPVPGAVIASVKPDHRQARVGH